MTRLAGLNNDGIRENLQTSEICLNPGSNIVAADVIPEGFQPEVLGVNTQDENQLSSSLVNPVPVAGEVLGDSETACQKQWLPLLFILALLINIIVISRFSFPWFVLFLAPAVTLFIDYMVSKNSCCYGQKWLCNYYWLGNILSFLVPLFLSKIRKK